MLPLTRFSVLSFNYLDSTSPTKFCDCEAIFLDFTGWGDGDASKGDLYIVPKWGRGKANTLYRAFKVPASAWPTDFDGSATTMYSPKAIVGSNNNDGIMGKTVTSAEMSLDGTVIAVGTTTSTYLFLRCPGVSVAEALQAQPCHSQLEAPIVWSSRKLCMVSRWRVGFANSRRQGSTHGMDYARL